MKHITQLLTITLIIFLTSPALAADNTDIYIQPSSTDIKVGNHYTLDLFAAENTDIGALDITLSFEGSSLEFVGTNNLQQTSLTINQQINPVILLNTINYSNNSIRLALTWPSTDIGEPLWIARLPLRAVSAEDFQFIPQNCKIVTALNGNLAKQSIQISPILIAPNSLNHHTSSHNNSTRLWTSQQPAPLQDFGKVKDLPPESYIWCFESIKFIVEKGIIPLDKDNNFYPDKMVTTNEFDVYLSKIIDNINRPVIKDDPVTRIEAAVRIAEVLDLQLPALEESNLILSPFNDIGIINQYQRRCLAACVKHGIFLGYADKTIRTAQPLTRAEAAVVLNRIYLLDYK